MQNFKPGSIIGSRYELKRFLGQGGKGKVYLAGDLHEEGAPVTIKILHIESPGVKNVASLRDGLSQLARLRHTNLVPIIDFGILSPNNAPFLVKEYVEGKDIFQATSDWEPRAIIRQLSILCNTLQYLHSRDIAHQGIKPSNIFFTGNAEKTGTLKLLDYGLAYWVVGTRQSADLGMLPYVAPEILSGQTANAKSDLYSLGILIYQLLTRHLPFEDDDPGFLIQKHLQARPDVGPIERLETGSGVPLLVASLLEKDPAKRPSSAEEVIRLLQVACGETFGEIDLPSGDAYFSTAQFVGREAEMSYLQSRSEQVRGSGRGSTIFLIGESGCGKTRLMQEFRIWALLGGWRVIDARCQQIADKPYEPYRQILARTKADVRHQPGGLEEYNTALCSDETPRVTEPESFEPLSDSAAGQFRDSLTRKIVGRLSSQPSVLLLDDFHWADEAIAAVLDYLSSDILPYPILICVCARSGEVEHGPTGALIEKCIRQERAERMILEPLDEESVRQLIVSMTEEPDLGQAIGPWVFRSSGGNPFFVEEILKHLVDGGMLVRRLGSWRIHQDLSEEVDLPAGVATVLRQRLSRLSEVARELAAWLAVFNRPISSDLLAAIAPVDSVARLEAIRELVSRHVVRNATSGQSERLEFCHTAIAEVIREDMKPRLRKGFHAKIGEALELSHQESGNIQEIAAHFMEAQFGEKAIQYSLKAAAECRSEFANEKALQFLEYVLTHTNNLSQEQLCQVAIDAADACCALGIPKRAIRSLERFIRKYNQPDHRYMKARLCLHLAQVYRCTGDPKRSAFMCRRGISYLDMKDSTVKETDLKRELLSNLAWCKLASGRYQEARRTLEQVLSYRDEKLDPVITGHIKTFASGLYFTIEDYLRGYETGKDALDLLLPRNVLHLLPMAYSHLGINLQGLGKFDLAIAEHEKAISIVKRTRSFFLQWQAMCNLIESLCRSGRFSLALGASEELRRLSIQNESQYFAIEIRMCLLELQISVGDYQSAFKTLKSIDAYNLSSLRTSQKARIQNLTAWFMVEIGDYDGGLNALRRFNLKNTLKCDFYQTAQTKILLARIYINTGKNGDALRILRNVDRISTKLNKIYEMCLTKIWLGYIYQILREWDLAEKAAIHAQRLAQEMSTPNLEAEALFRHASVIRSRYLASEHLKAASDSDPVTNGWQRLAREKLERSVEISRKFQIDDILWKCHFELAKIESTLRNKDSVVSHAEEALQILSKFEVVLPADGANLFCRYNQRGQAKHECQQFLRNEGIISSGLPLKITDLREEQLRMLLRASGIFNALRDLDSLLEAITDLILKATCVQRIFIFLKRDILGQLSLAKAKSVNQDSLIYEASVVKAIINKVNTEEEPFLTANARTDSRLTDSDENAFGQVGALMCAPLKISGQILGVLYVDHPVCSESLDESVVSLFAAFCNLSAVAIDNALTHRRLVREKTELEQYLISSETVYPEIVGVSSAIKSLRDRIALVAAAPLDVLIRGESGTGKELVAHAIHRTGRRAKGSFIALDCGALSETLVESELFGYRKGAFTGAIENRAGLLETAHGGVVFLDEISNLMPRLQAKLLRVLQEREVRRIGEATARPIDVQIIAATNKDLRGEIRKGKFRKDLYYRLNVMEICVPPLRERLEDVPLLIQWFLDIIAKQENGKTKGFSPEALALLCQYFYPGNVRELKNIVQRGFYSCRESTIGIPNLPNEVREDQPHYIEASSIASGKALEIFSSLCEGTGSFAELVREPLRHAQMGPVTVRQIIQLALRESRGKYRQAFRLLRIPDKDYHLTMAFLKRNKCYVDFHPFRGRNKGN
jgi:transcriptional regulator with GAF, ATPase, and Fis domain